MMQLVLSIIPWWLYAICAVAAYFAARHYLGEKIALAYAIAAAAWVAMDYGGDQREAWLKAEGAKAVAQADASISAAAEAMATSLQAQLDEKSKELDDYVASYKPAGDVCAVGHSLDGLPGWGGRR